MEKCELQSYIILPYNGYTLFNVGCLATPLSRDEKYNESCVPFSHLLLRFCCSNKPCVLFVGSTVTI